MAPSATIDMAEVVLTRELPPGPQSARAARAFVEATLREWGHADLIEVARLLTSELVTNAILHAGTAIRVTVRVAEDRVRVEVEDRTGGTPTRLHRAVDATTGRGLAIVEEIASSWGAQRTGSGKVVWFEMGAPGSGR